MPPRRADIDEWVSLADADSARLVRPIQSDVLIRAASVSLRDDVLVFETPNLGQSLRRSVWMTGAVNVPSARIPTDLLERFLRLASAEAVLPFARRYGPLGGFGHVDPTFPAKRP